MTVAAPETSSHVTIFAAEWCPFCRKLRERLDRTAYGLPPAGRGPVRASAQPA